MSPLGCLSTECRVLSATARSDIKFPHLYIPHFPHLYIYFDKLNSLIYFFKSLHFNCYFFFLDERRKDPPTEAPSKPSQNLDIVKNHQLEIDKQDQLESRSSGKSSFFFMF
jgi:hypothetical protein